jgi:hypothetical protein
VVIAPCTVAAVQHAGGWLFDHVLAGWDAMVFVAGRPDSRPLRILGAGVTDIESALALPRGPRPQTLAVEAGLYESDGRIRQVVRDALDDGTTQVMIWGGLCPADLDNGAGSVEHRLSTAARAFKAQALAAAAVPAESIPVTETFREPPRIGRPPDLVSVSR